MRIRINRKLLVWSPPYHPSGTDGFVWERAESHGESRCFIVSDGSTTQSSGSYFILLLTSTSISVQFWETQEIFSRSVKLWTHCWLQKTIGVANTFIPYWAASRKTLPPTRAPHSEHLSQQFQVIYRAKVSEQVNKEALRNYDSAPKPSELPL